MTSSNLINWSFCSALNMGSGVMADCQMSSSGQYQLISGGGSGLITLYQVITGLLGQV
jgi:hypothetical protein